MMSGPLRIPLGLKWTMVAGGVVGYGVALTTSCAPTNPEPESTVCVGVADGSFQEIPYDGSACPDGDIQTVV